MQVGTKKLPMVVWPIRACNKFNRGVGIMKKLISVLCAVVMMAVFAVPAFAATSKSDIISEIKAGVKVGDKVKQIPSKYVEVAENFLAANDLTAEQLDTAMADLKEAKEVWASTGKTEFKDIPADVQKKLQNMAAASAKKIGATLTFDGKTISVVDAQGRSYSVLAKSSNPIKQTGADYTMLIVLSAAVLVVLGGTVIVARRNRLGKDC